LIIRTTVTTLLRRQPCQWTVILTRRRRITCLILSVCLTLIFHCALHRRSEESFVDLNSSDQTQRLRRASLASSHGSVPSLTNSLTTNSSSSFLHGISSGVPSFELPAFIKPTPTRIPVEDVEYLWRKGALTLPDEPLRSILLKAHFDFVHPYMPLLDRKNFLNIVNTKDSSKGRVGLLLFQAVMFSGSAVSHRNPLSIP